MENLITVRRGSVSTFPDSGNHVNTLSLVCHAGPLSANMSAHFVVALNPVLQPFRIISKDQV
jgi:hypothetical protein